MCIYMLHTNLPGVDGPHTDDAFLVTRDESFSQGIPLHNRDSRGVLGVVAERRGLFLRRVCGGRRRRILKDSNRVK
jgi:hypothetical protein